MSAIQLENVAKFWGQTKALENISFTVEAGKLLVLLGPSGCGKSTTLRLIAGLESVTSGKIFIDGTDVTNLPPSERRLSMVFQSYALFPHMTVRENILFGLKVRKIPEAEQKIRLERAVEILGLSLLLERKPTALSGGQQQRVALGRALVAEAAVCLMDEPLSNLDAKLRQEMRREIRDLQQKLGMTMVYVTHDQVEAMTMADTIILMENGHIVQNDPPELLYTRPATTFVANFIGTPPMNLVKLAKGNTGIHIEGCPEAKIENANVENCILGIRPEHVQISENIGWPAEVTSVEYLGANSVIACRIGNQEISVMAGGNSKVCIGAKLYLKCPLDSLHFFDATHKRRQIVTNLS